MALTKAPAPGIYRDMSFAEYQAIDACNFSALKVIKEFSPLQYRFKQMMELKKESQALRRGRAMHTLILEPEEFEKHYITGVKCSAFKKGDGKPCENDATKFSGGKWFCGTHKPAVEEAFDGEILSEADMRMVRGTALAIENRPCANAFVRMGNRTPEGKSNNEVVAVWIDPDFDVPCKCRIDMVRELEWNAFGDLKSTQNPNELAFSDTIGDYWYDGQAGFYRKGWVLAGGNDVKNFNFFALQSAEPYDIGMFTIKDEAEMGWYSTRKWVGIWAGCWRSGSWYGCEAQFADITLSRRGANARLKEMEGISILGMNLPR